MTDDIAKVRARYPWAGEGPSLGCHFTFDAFVYALREARAEGFRAGVTKAADFVCTIQHIRGTPNAILSLLTGDGKAKVGLTETLTTVLEDARVPGVINDQIVDMIARWEASLTPPQKSE